MWCAGARGFEPNGRATRHRILELQHAKAPVGVWFVPNAGQWADEARYAARVNGGDWWLTESGWKVEMLGPGADTLGARIAHGAAGFLCAGCALGRLPTGCHRC